MTAPRPTSLDTFAGQGHFIPNLQIFVKSARMRKKALAHVLLSGPPGLGKTTLAAIIANELGVKMHSVMAPSIKKIDDLIFQLGKVHDRDVLFIDEIHRLPAAVFEMLFGAMEDFRVDVAPSGEAGAQETNVPLPHFTLIGATTRSGALPQPMRDRFGIQLQMQLYELDDLCKVVVHAAHEMGVVLAPDGVVEVARRARGTPRIAIQLIDRLLDFAIVKDWKIVTSEHVEETTTALGIDGIGLNAMDRRYLASMIEYYRGGPVGLETMATVLGEHRDVVEYTIEPYLVLSGLLGRGPAGRQVTEHGYAHMGLQAPENATQPTKTRLDDLVMLEAQVVKTTASMLVLDFPMRKGVYLEKSKLKDLKIEGGIAQFGLAKQYVKSNQLH